MDHLDAEQLKAVERYMLGDLSVSEVEEFERHFFDCPQCSEELRTLTMFQENARAVFIEQDAAVIVPPSVHVPESTGWWQRLSPHMFSLGASLGMAAACLVIGIFAGRSVLAPRANLEAVSEYPIFAQARGEETVVSPRAGSSFGIYLDPSWDGDYSGYHTVLLDASGAEKASTVVERGGPDGAIHIQVPSHKLTAGKYVLVIFGHGIDKNVELARYPFTLKLQ